MKLIDISGPIYNGMWSYSDIYPKFNLKTLKIEYLDENYFVDVFEGMHCQTGTYLESTKAFSEGKKTYTINDVDLQKLVMIDAYVLQIPLHNLMIKDDKPYISLKQIKQAEKESIPNNSSILIATGYGKHWGSQDYVEKCWFFKRDAFDYLLDKKPFLLGTDSPNWENEVNPEGIFDRLYKSGILCLAPCVNVENIVKYKVKLIVLPLKIVKAGICPARAIVIEDYV